VARSSAVLSWSTVALTAAYRLEWRSLGGTFTPVTMKQAAYTLRDLTPGTYEWRVRSMDSSYPPIESKVSPLQSFTVSTASPTLTSPLDAVLDSSPDTQVLTWGAVPGASRYVVRIADNESGLNSTPLATFETTATAIAPTSQLKSATQYWWSVTAVGERAGTVLPLGTSSTGRFTIVTPPRDALYQQLSVNGTSLTISWTPLAGEARGSTDPHTYDVQYRAVADGLDTPWTSKTVTSSSTTSLTISGLAMATKYEARVRARNPYGAGPWPTYISPVTTSTVLGQVQLLQATSVANGVSLTWSSPMVTATAPAATGYRVRYSLAGQATWVTKSLPAYPLSVTLTGLKGYTSYDVEVSALNPVGYGAVWMITSKTLGAPSAPQSVKATRGNASATVSWAKPVSNGGSAITGYMVQTRYYTTAWSGWSTRINPSAATFTASLTGLVNGRRYEVRVLARNDVAASGGTPSASVAFVPATKPSAPKSVKTVSGTKKITISWAKPVSNGSTLTGYVIQYTKDRKTWSTLKTLTSASYLSFGWTGPRSNTVYYFRVKATSNLGSSAYSSLVIGVAK
jgi:hypothetical protein